MSSLTNTVPFSLDEINLRKKLVFPDGTIQSTAYTGAVGGSTLAEVLADGNNANFLTINDLAGVIIADIVGGNSSITQSTINLHIESGDLSGSVDSSITLAVTNGAGASAVAVTVAEAGVTIVPPVTFNSTSPPIAPLAVQPSHSDNSNKMPTTAWVQSAIQQRTAFVDFINTTNTISITNSFVTVTPVNIIPLPTLPAEGQYLLSFSLQLEFASGLPENIICRENVTSAIPGQISTVVVRPYQYPNFAAIFQAYGTGVYVSGTYILNTLVAGATGLEFDLECAWSNGGNVDCVAQSIQISYLGSSTGAV
jgi:hypothetical protein